MSALQIAEAVATPRMELVRVTPDMARELLGRNTHNRRLSQTVVAKYAHDMRSGLWRDGTPEPLAVDRNGVLQQGQHRLHAVIQADVSVVFWIAWDTDPEDFRVLDQGKRRNVSDVLGMQGVPSASAVATAARVALLHQKYPDMLWTGQNVVTNSDVIEFCDANRSVLAWAVGQGQAAWRGARVPRSQYAAVAALVALSSESLGLWERWHAGVCDGLMLTSGDPAHALRRWAVGPAAAKSSGSGQQQVRQAVITKAWNAFVRDRDVKVLYWRKNELPLPLPLPSVEVDG